MKIKSRGLFEGGCWTCNARRWMHHFDRSVHVRHERNWHLSETLREIRYRFAALSLLVRKACGSHLFFFFLLTETPAFNFYRRNLKDRSSLAQRSVPARCRVSSSILTPCSAIIVATRGSQSSAEIFCQTGRNKIGRFRFVQSRATNLTRFLVRLSRWISFWVKWN